MAALRLRSFLVSFLFSPVLSPLFFTVVVLLLVLSSLELDVARALFGSLLVVDLNDRLPGLAESVPRTSLFLTDTESDLVYHIECGRESDSSDNEEIHSETCQSE